MIAQTQCIRCGKPRVFAKTWNEQIGISQVTYVQNVCPDAECQKLVEALLQERHDISFNRQEESIKRRKLNMETRAIERKATTAAKNKKNEKKS